MEIHELSAREIASGVKARKFSAADVAAHFLGRINRLDGKIHAFLNVDERRTLAEAKEIDRRIAAGENPGPLAGVPVAVKDNISTKGIRTTAASKILENYVPPYNAHVVELLRGAGAAILGKTNLDEFAMGSSSEFSAFGPTKNPWDLTRVPGGSSSGSAAAVAARLAPLALGSDTGGSIRQPAAFCGITGLKPTYGRVSRYGLLAFASSLDQIGAFATNVEDAALALDVISTPDERDSTCGRAPRENHLAACGRGVKGLKIGIPKEYFTSALDPEVESLVRAGIKTLESLGAEIREISLPHTEHAVAAYYVVAEAEASSNLARYDGVQYGLRVAAEDMISTFRKTRSAGFGPEVTRRILLGTFVLSSGFYDAYYAKAKKVQTLIRRDFEAAFREVGAIACPVAPTAAFKIGEKISNPLEMYLSDILTVALNLAGLPGIAIPCGFTKSKLPAGLQIIAPPGKDALMLQTAAAYERATEWHKQIPPLAKGE